MAQAEGEKERKDAVFRVEDWGQTGEIGLIHISNCLNVRPGVTSRDEEQLLGFQHLKGAPKTWYRDGEKEKAVIPKELSASK